MFLNVDCACCDSVFACVLKRGTFFYSNSVRVRQHVDEREVATPIIIAAASLNHKMELRYLKLNISLTMHCFNTKKKKKRISEKSNISTVRECDVQQTYQQC